MLGVNLCLKIPRGYKSVKERSDSQMNNSLKIRKKSQNIFAVERSLYSLCNQVLADCFYLIMCLTGGQAYRILPLHSQIPREDQHKVFIPAPEGVTKVTLYDEAVDQFGIVT